MRLKYLNFPFGLAYQFLLIYSLSWVNFTFYKKIVFICAVNKLKPCVIDNDHFYIKG